MSSKIVVFLALFAFSYGFTLPAEYALSLDDSDFPVQYQVVAEPTYYAAPLPDEHVVAISRVRRQVHQPEPLKDGQRGRVDVTGEQMWRNHKNMGTDFNVDATGRLWQSQDGRSTVSGTANYNRHFGGPGGTGRPNYGAFVNFNHRF